MRPCRTSRFQTSTTSPPCTVAPGRGAPKERARRCWFQHHLRVHRRILNPLPTPHPSPGGSARRLIAVPMRDGARRATLGENPAGWTRDCLAGFSTRPGCCRVDHPARGGRDPRRAPSPSSPRWSRAVTSPLRGMSGLHATPAPEEPRGATARPRGRRSTAEHGVRDQRREDHEPHHE